MNERNSSRTLWLVIGGVAALVLFSVCAVALVASSALVFYPVRSTSSSPPPIAVTAVVRPAAPQPAPTPLTQRPEIVVSPDGKTDYETAVLMAIYQQYNASVVNISVLALVSSQLPGQSLPNDINPDDLLPQGQGSGFVWDTDGHIVTNDHVVEGAEQVQVTFSDGTVAIAAVIGSDPDSDLAVLKIDPDGYSLVPVKLGDLNQMQVGMRVAAIGNPFGLQGTLTSGIISAIGRSISSLTQFNIPEAIQTDAAINPGNSGGPLFNERGEVIGVNAQIRSSVRSNSGVGFAIPVTIVQRVVPALISDGRYEHSYIGVSGTTFSPICAEDLGLNKQVRGAYISEVRPNTPASQAGLRGGSTPSATKFLGICPTQAGGDLITAIDGEPVTQFDDLLIYLERYTSPGDQITLTVLRAGRQEQIQVTLAARPR